MKPLNHTPPELGELKVGLVFGFVLILLLVLLVLYYLARYTTILPIQIPNIEEVKSNSIFLDIIVTFFVLLMISITIWAWTSAVNKVRYSGRLTYY